MKAVIIAGGSGTRLWPISRKQKPKQFQKMTSDKTMLQETYERLSEYFLQEDIYISTICEYVDEVRTEIDGIKDDHIIAEPKSRNTAPGIALAAAVVAAHHGDDTIVAVFPADHLIKNNDILFAALNDAKNFITKNGESIITLGLEPNYPETGYGYIKKGTIKESGDNVFKVERFIEKPDVETAQSYIDDGGYYWNAGMFIFVAGAMLDKYKKYIPSTHAHIMTIKESVGTQDYNEVLKNEYSETDAISVDYAIMENDDCVFLVPISDLGWSDVGSWAALKDALVGDGKEHLVRGEHIGFESENLVVHGSSKPIVTIGLKDLIIVDTENVLLVCHRDKSQLVSSVVKSLNDTKHKTLI